MQHSQTSVGHMQATLPLTPTTQAWQLPLASKRHIIGQGVGTHRGPGCEPPGPYTLLMPASTTTHPRKHAVLAFSPLFTPRRNAQTLLTPDGRCVSACTSLYQRATKTIPPPPTRPGRINSAPITHRAPHSHSAAPPLRHILTAVSL